MRGAREKSVLREVKEEVKEKGALREVREKLFFRKVIAHHTKEHMWVDNDGEGGWKDRSGKEQGLIIVQAGREEGWVVHVFKLRTNRGDNNQDEMNSEHYME